MPLNKSSSFLLASFFKSWIQESTFVRLAWKEVSGGKGLLEAFLDEGVGGGFKMVERRAAKFLEVRFRRRVRMSRNIQASGKISAFWGSTV